MENIGVNEKKLEDLLKIVLKLKQELNEAYLILKTNFNPLKNIDIFDNKRTALKETAEKIKDFGAFSTDDDRDEDNEKIKELIKAEMREIAELNNAFSGLIKKNIYYNQLTISFITDAFNKSSIYDRAGGNNSNFFPLKNVLMKSGVRV
ncbi:MAG: flagellar protein FlgN [Deltaproteobacteria bacterium]|jgi:hypothetical protein|nr:flagellar protein FlgN [Deltaproteobacteria bacterium]